MNLSSGRGSYGLWAIWPRFAISPRRPRGPPPPPDRLPLPRRHSTRLLPPLHLSLSSTSDSSPRSLSPSIPEKLSRPSATADAAASVRPPPRASHLPCLRGRSPPPARPDAPRVAALFVPSPGCLPPPPGPCLVRDSLAPRSPCGVLT